MTDVPQAAIDAAHEATACRIGEPDWAEMLAKSPYDLIDMALAAAAPHIAAAERERIYAELGNDHYVIFKPAGWTTEHSLECRLSGRMSECAWHEAVKLIADEYDPEMLGRWRIDAIDSEGLAGLTRAEDQP